MKIGFASLLITFSLIFSACDDGGGITVPSGVTNLSVSMKSKDNLAANSNDVIVITEAKAIVANMDFEIEGTSNIQRMEIGSFIMNLGLDGSLKSIKTGYIFKDNFTKIKLQVHKTEETETPEDPEFKAGTAENLRYSFIVKGTYNGNSFVYKSKKSFLIVVGFPQTINVNLTDMNITVLFDKQTWFKNGNTILDPNNVQNETLIDENIRQSFKQAFKDNDYDGLPDAN